MFPFLSLRRELRDSLQLHISWRKSKTDHTINRHGTEAESSSTSCRSLIEYAYLSNPTRLNHLLISPIEQPVPLPGDGSDDEMVDAPNSDAPTPVEDQNDDAQDGEDGDEDGDDGDEAGTPARDSEAASRSMTPVRFGRPSIPRKRRLGRPPKSRPPEWDAQDDAQEATSDTGTPKRTRGRGRGGGRWAKARGGPSHRTQVPIDKEGNTLDVIDDEVALPEDPEGETKVDKLGYLQAGREYRVRTFTVQGRGERLYMLSTEPARCIGFRDSYLFFQKHPLLYKIIIDEDAKRDLIDRELIPHSYKGRAIGVVTARSVFREFGARIIIGGKNIVDDYNVQAARERGEVEGELAVPDDRLPGPGEAYNRNQYVAWHGASSVYHTGGPSVPMMNGKPAEAKKRKIAVTSDNWMLEHARETRYESYICLLCKLMYILTNDEVVSTAPSPHSDVTITLASTMSTQT